MKRIINLTYPPKGKAKRSQWGPLDSLSILYVIGEVKLGFQKHQRGSDFFEISKTFIARRELLKQNPNGVQLFLLIFNLLSRKVL